jgi:hypothetical protein
MQALNDARADARANLPPPDTKRWVARRKAAILVAINTGVLSRAQACARYHISEIELRLWERAVYFAGVPGLRVTRVQIYKPIFEADAPRQPRTTPFE